ncbi:MAG: hypothetical protein WKF84_13585 [Pyrinomonadaceae bacterium]
MSEYHTGYRAFTREVLESLPLEENTNDFAFDNEMLAQIIYFGYRIGEISCPTKYFEDASSINFTRSVKYGLGVLATSLKFRLQKMHLNTSRIFNPQGSTILYSYYEQVGKSTAETHPRSLGTFTEDAGRIKLAAHGQ